MTVQAKISDLPGWPCPTRISDIANKPDSWGWIPVGNVSRPICVWYDELGALWANGDAVPRYRHPTESDGNPGAIVYWTESGIGLYVHPKSYAFLSNRSRLDNTPEESWVPVVEVVSKPPVTKAPLCPVCGASVHVERIDVTAAPGRRKEYVLGGDTRCSADERHDVTAVALAWLSEEAS